MGKWKGTVVALALIGPFSQLLILPGFAAGNSNSATPSTTVEKSKKDSGAKSTPDAGPTKTSTETQTPVLPVEKEKRVESTAKTEVIPTSSAQPKSPNQQM